MSFSALDITCIKGILPLLIVAPHGVNGYPMDDIHTGKIAEIIARKINCWAIINQLFHKPRENQRPSLMQYRLDLNRVDNAIQHPTYLDRLQGIVNTYSHIIIVWLHGIKDANLADEVEALCHAEMRYCPVHGIFGFGQGPHPRKADSRSAYTADLKTVEKLRRQLYNEGLNVILGAKFLSKYRGRHPGYMNQWFRIQGYPLSQVECIQLELGFKGVRRLEDIEKTAFAIARALKVLV
jgi:hypothetical protein